MTSPLFASQLKDWVNTHFTLLPDSIRQNIISTVANLDVYKRQPEDAEVLFIGEGPGENEDLTGQPFVGRGGKLLDQYLYDVDLDRKAGGVNA